MKTFVTGPDSSDGAVAAGPDVRKNGTAATPASDPGLRP